MSNGGENCDSHSGFIEHKRTLSGHEGPPRGSERLLGSSLVRRLDQGPNVVPTAPASPLSSAVPQASKASPTQTHTQVHTAHAHPSSAVNLQVTVKGEL